MVSGDLNATPGQLRFDLSRIEDWTLLQEAADHAGAMSPRITGKYRSSLEAERLRNGFGFCLGGLQAVAGWWFEIFPCSTLTWRSICFVHELKPPTPPTGSMSWLLVTPLGASPGVPALPVPERISASP